MSATTGWTALDEVLCGIEPGDNIVWAVDSIGHYARLVAPYDQAAREHGHQRVYFRFGPDTPLLEPGDGLEICHADPRESFEGFIRAVHEVIERVGPGAVYLFDCISHLGDVWQSDQALANFFMLTCPRLRDLQTVTYFAIERRRHSLTALNAIRTTTQFYLEVFSADQDFYIRPVKVQYRARAVMDTLHVEKAGKLEPVHESAILAQILTQSISPLNLSLHEMGYWTRMFHELDEAIAEKAEGRLSAQREQRLLACLQRAFCVHRSGIAELVKRWLKLEDYFAIRQRLIGVGSIGGKAFGMLVARAIVRDRLPEIAARLEVHDSFFVGAEVFVTYLVQNRVWWIREQQKVPECFLKDVEKGQERLLQGHFPSEVVAKLEGMLDYFGEKPCIVRSSSILEDARGNAFSGKYESIFLTNRGSREDRLVALLQAIRRVYASILDPDTLEYRRARNLLQSEERMALLIMRVSGARRGEFFFPQAAGVALSYNPYKWHPEIESEAGMVRMVFGLGTRAVDRADDDYTRLVSLSMPERRPEASLGGQWEHSQRRMDVLDLAGAGLRSLPVEEVLPECSDFPLEYFISRSGGPAPWVSFGGLIRRQQPLNDLRAILRELSEAYAEAVDMEFALNVFPDDSYRIHLLQCRTFQVRKGMAHVGVNPATVGGRCVLETNGAVIGLGREVVLDDILYVPTAAYAALSEAQRYQVVKIIEQLVQKHDTRRTLVLIGPGRWGTSSASLGIPIRAGRIARASAVCEMVEMHERLIPDVSLGTHFFNDLVEHDLLYIACFPDKAGNRVDVEWFLHQPSRTSDLVSIFPEHHDTVRWISVPGMVLHADPMYQTAAIRIAESTG